MTSTGRGHLLFWLGAFALLLVALYQLSSILLPFVAGCAIAYFLDPAVRRLEAWRLPRGLATAVMLLVFFATILLILALLLPLLELQAAELVRRAPAAVDWARQEIQQLMVVAQQRLAPEDFARLRDLAGERAGTAVGWVAGLLQGVLTRGVALANLLSLVFVTPVVAFFLLRDWARLLAAIDRWLPRHRAEIIREQARLVDATLTGFVHGQLLVGVALAAYYGIALSLAGLNFAIILGILIGALSFIPYLGFAIGLVLAMGLALIQFGIAGWLLVILGIFGLGQLLEGSFLSPKLVGERVHLHPVWVIFALLAGGALFGLVGVLLALPTAAVIGVLVRFALGRYLASGLYDPPSDPRDGRI